MQNRKPIAQALVALGSLLLFACAGLHGILGYGAVFGALHETSAPRRTISALKAAWLMDSWHWIAVGILALIAAFAPTSPHRAVLFLCGLVAFVDAASAYSSVGLFIGDELLAVAAIVFFASVTLFSRPLTNRQIQNPT